MFASAENIRRWRNQLEDKRLGRRIRQTADLKVLELKRLRKEFAEVKMKKDILRKASGILLGETQVKFEFIRQQMLTQQTELILFIDTINPTNNILIIKKASVAITEALKLNRK